MNNLVQVAPGAQPSGAGQADDAPRVVPRALSNRQKAAIVVRLLLNEGADIPLEELPDELQETLTHQLGQMGLVDRITLDAVAQEFAEALDSVGLSFPHGHTSCRRCCSPISDWSYSSPPHS